MMGHLRDFHGPDDRITVGFGGVWTLPMPGPNIKAIPRLSDKCRGLTTGAHYIERMQAESVDALIQRAALAHGTAEPFELEYAT